MTGSPDTIRIAAPATTANLGPGYDCLGMALDIWNTIEVEPLPAGSASSVAVSGEGEGELEAGPENLVYRSMEFLYRELGRELPRSRSVAATKFRWPAGWAAAPPPLQVVLPRPTFWPVASSATANCWRWPQQSRDIPTTWRPQ